MRTTQIAGTILTTLTALPMARGGDSQERENLTFHERESQVGVAAKRELRDADDLDVLTMRASLAAKTKPDLDTEGLLVKYYSGVNHLHHGLLENGAGEFFSRPAPGVYFTEHCFNKEGKLVKAIVNQEDGTRYVSRTFWYEDGQPAGMMTFEPNGHSFSDVGLYKEGRLSMVARISPAGKVMSASDEAPVDPHEAELERLANQAPKLHLKKLLDYNLEKLESVYQAALKSADDAEHRRALGNSQKAWLEFFAADGVVADWNAKGGSFAYPAQMEQRIYQVRSRIYQLSTPFMQGWQAIPRIPNPRGEQQGG